jgi:hypothetical protein
VTDARSRDEQRYQGFSRPGPHHEPPGWIDGAPTDPRDQSCAICGDREVVWVHPLHANRVTYREYGKGHTLPSFWCLCQRCEDLHRAGRDDELIEIMKSASGWYWETAEDIDECLSKPLAVFRNADKNGRRLAVG